ncbi:myristylated protein [White-tailed deer poxvirus]|nr:myristylated protein [White-tailed deer poxvirus]
MGASFTVPDNVKRPPIPPKKTSEMNLNVDNMYELIGSLNQISDVLHIGVITDDKKKQLEKRFPEFMFMRSGPGNLYNVIRSTYTNDTKYCCKNLKLKSYWKDSDGNISILYRPNTILNSCDPDLQNSGKCDSDLFSWCQSNTSDKNICNDWMYTMLSRDNTASETLINKFISLCSKNADTPICEMFLHNLRAKNTESYDNVIDYILYLQSDDFKNTYMRCSYPSTKTLEESLRYSEARECWDPECANANVNFLLTRNYKNLGLCTINRCNVSINHLNIDNKSKLRMACNNLDLTSPYPVNREKVILHNIDNSFELKIHCITILSILVIWLLIVAI